MVMFPPTLKYLIPSFDGLVHPRAPTGPQGPPRDRDFRGAPPEWRCQSPTWANVLADGSRTCTGRRWTKFQDSPSGATLTHQHGDIIYIYICVYIYIYYSVKVMKWESNDSNGIWFWLIWCSELFVMWIYPKIGELIPNLWPFSWEKWEKLEKWGDPWPP